MCSCICECLPHFFLDMIGQQNEGRKGAEAEARVQAAVKIAERCLETTAKRKVFFVV